MELLIGCGSARDRRIHADGQDGWSELLTCDVNPAHSPDVLADLTVLPWPFGDDMFTEVHAYELLEHLGSQGDYVSFFAQFSEIWRILEPDGVLCATVPAPDSPWLWGDPGHTRAILPNTLVFLSQAEYEVQVGHTPMSDYRYCYKADFRTLFTEIKEHTFSFVLQAKKAPTPGDSSPV